jgi:multidrug resistance efflux pump
VTAAVSSAPVTIKAPPLETSEDLWSALMERIARGITDQGNKNGLEMLASVNPTFTWVRLAQRIPVRIRITNVPAGVLIAAGMTCTVTLKNEI